MATAQTHRSEWAPRTLLAILVISAILSAAWPSNCAGEEPAWDMPHLDPSASAEFEGDYLAFQHRPFDCEAFEFSLVARRLLQWAGVATDPGQASASPAILAHGADDLRAGEPALLLNVSLFTLDHQVTALDWLTRYVERAGMRPLRAHLSIYAGAQPLGEALVPEFLVRAGAPGRERISRLAAFKDGRRVFLVQASCPAASYPTAARELALATLSFRLVHPTGRACAEEESRHRIDGINRLAFRFPASWTVHPQRGQPTGVDYVHLALTSDGQCHALVNVATYSTRHFEPTLEDALAVAHAHAERLGGTGMRPIAEDGLAPGTRRFAFELAGANWVLEATCEPMDGCWVFVYLLAPARAESEDTYLIARSAMAMVRSSLSQED